MATYGRGQMLGSGINPESFKQDYSGFANAAAIQAKGVADLGASIGGVIKDFGEAKQEQKKVDAYNKASAKAIEAAITLGKSYEIAGAEETLRPFIKLYNDPNLSPIEKAALLDEGKAMIPNVFGRFDQKQALNIQKAQLLAKNAPSPRSVNLQQGTITETINGKQYEVPTIFDPSTGETRRLDGSIVGSTFRSPNIIDAGLNLPMAEQTVMPGDSNFPNYGSPSEAMVLPPKNNADAIAAAAELTGGRSDVSNISPMPEGTTTTTGAPKIDGIPTSIASGESSARIPLGAVPVQSKALASFRRATPEEAAGYGAVAGQIDEQTGRFYPINLPTGMTVESDGQGGIKVVQGSGVGAKVDQQKKAEENKVDKAMALTQDLNLLEDKVASMAPGVSGAVGRIVAEQIPATPQAENKEIIDRVISTLTLENLQAMRNNSPTGAALGNVSDKDTGLMRDSATSLRNAQSPESFKRELIRLKNLQHDVIYGSERVLKNKLEKGEITQSEFDEAARKAPSQYINEKGVVTDRKTIPIAPISDLQSIYDKYLTPETAK